MTKKVLFALIFTLFSSSFSFSNTNGQMLLSGCTEALKYVESGKMADPFSTAYCLGVTRGVFDTNIFLSGGLKDGEQIICPRPDEQVTNGQMVYDVMEFLLANENLLGEADTLLVLAAFSQKYPCGS